MRNAEGFVQTYTQVQQGQRWLARFRGKQPLFVCVLGFTETGLVEGISAAGATPADRQFTAVADAEFLVKGPQAHPRYPLPPLQMGASPVLISRAVIEQQAIPLRVFNAGLPQQLEEETIDLGGTPARCLSSGQALDAAVVKHLLHQGLQWGGRLAIATDGYLILSECVVGGTTTALAVLTGLGIDAAGKVNSSHSVCNHAQKWTLVQAGLRQAGRLNQAIANDAIALVAAVGDPMQIVVAGMTIAASRTCGVLLAGGTQMLAVYALARTIAAQMQLDWNPTQVIVGTTRWVADDPTGDTVGLAEQIGGVSLSATSLNFAHSRHSQLQAYEHGFVKEGVGAGGCAIAAHLYKGWQQTELLNAIEALADRTIAIRDQFLPNPSSPKESASSFPTQNHSVKSHPFGAS